MSMHRNRGSGTNMDSSYTSGSGAHYLEQENDQMVDSLKGKVSALKSLGIEIGDEVRSQNKLLDDMDSDFDSSKGLLGSTMRRLGIVSKSGGHRFMCYLIIFAFAVFIVIYYLVTRR